MSFILQSFVLSFVLALIIAMLFLDVENSSFVVFNYEIKNHLLKFAIGVLLIVTAPYLIVLKIITSLVM